MKNLLNIKNFTTKKLQTKIEKLITLSDLEEYHIRSIDTITLEAFLNLWCDNQIDCIICKSIAAKLVKKLSKKK